MGGQGWGTPVLEWRTSGALPRLTTPVPWWCCWWCCCHLVRAQLDLSDVLQSGDLRQELRQEVELLLHKFLSPGRVLVGWRRAHCELRCQHVASRRRHRGPWPSSPSSPRPAPQLRDKLTFVLGTLHMTLSAYWLGCSPQ